MSSSHFFLPRSSRMGLDEKSSSQVSDVGVPLCCMLVATLLLGVTIAVPVVLSAVHRVKHLTDRRLTDLRCCLQHCCVLQAHRATGLCAAEQPWDSSCALVSKPAADIAATGITQAQSKLHCTRWQPLHKANCPGQDSRSNYAPIPVTLTSLVQVLQRSRLQSPSSCVATLYTSPSTYRLPSAL